MQGSGARCIGCQTSFGAFRAVHVAKLVSNCNFGSFFWGNKQPLFPNQKQTTKFFEVINLETVICQMKSGFWQILQTHAGHHSEAAMWKTRKKTDVVRVESMYPFGKKLP